MMVKFTEGAPVPLDPAGYDGTYKLIGGRLCFDFVNTVSFRGSDEPHDWLEPPSNVVAWARAVGIIGESARRRLAKRVRSQPAEAARAAARLRRERATLYGVLAPLAGDAGRPGAEAMAAFNHLLAGVWTRRRIDRRTLAWTWEAPARLEQITGPVIVDAAHVLADIDHSRIGQCPACDWLFYDTTRNRSRRWCVMADCGSRDKALRYYHRTRGIPSP